MPTSGRENSWAATSQKRSPKAIVSVLPAMTASAFQVTLSGCFAPARCDSTASWVATSAGRQPARHAGVVEDREADVIGDPARFEPESAEDEPAQARGERQPEERDPAKPVLADHPAETLPVREPLPFRDGERVREAVLDDGRLGDHGLCSRAPQAPARVEADLEQRLALEHGRHEAEPVLAPARAVMVRERLPPVARAGNALESRLNRVEAARHELVTQTRERARPEHGVRVN